MPPSRSGDAGDTAYTSKWPHFQSLLFLKDVVRPRFSTGNLVTATESEIHLTSLNKAEIPTDNIENSDLSECTDIITSNQEEEKENIEEDTTYYTRHSPSPVQTIKGKKRNRNETFNDTLLNLEKQKIKYLQEKSLRRQNVDDEDLLFFKSLLPHVRKIPDSKKLAFCSCIQNFVEQFAYQQQSSTFCNQQSFDTSSPAVFKNTPQSFPSFQFSTSSENTTQSFLSKSNTCFPQSIPNSNYITLSTDKDVLNYTPL